MEIEPGSAWERLKPHSVVIVDKIAEDGVVIFRNSRGKRYGLRAEEFKAKFVPFNVFAGGD